MSSRRRPKHPPAITLRSLRWAAVLVLPFSALFVDTWLSTAMLKRDIRMAAVTEELKRVQEEYDACRVKIATLENLERIEIQAPDLGLVPPQPKQIKTIHYDESEMAWYQAAPPFETADAATRESHQAPREDSSWSFKTSPQQATSPMGLLLEAIAGACESFFGPS